MTYKLQIYEQVKSVFWKIPGTVATYTLYNQDKLSKWAWNGALYSGNSPSEKPNMCMISELIRISQLTCCKAKGRLSQQA